RLGDANHDGIALSSLALNDAEWRRGETARPKATGKEDPMTIPGTGSNPVTVTATISITTTSPADALEDFNDSIAGKIDSGVTVDGFGLDFTSTLNTATISVENDGTASTNQNSSQALVINAGTSGKLTYFGSGNVTDTGSGGDALNISNSGTGDVSVAISA